MMNLDETIDAVLDMFCKGIQTKGDSVDARELIKDAKQRLMLVCLTYVTSENENLLLHLPAHDVESECA